MKMESEIKRELPTLTYSILELLYLISITRKRRDGMASVQAVRDTFAQLHTRRLAWPNISQELRMLSKEKFIDWIVTGNERIVFSRVCITPKGLEELNRSREA